MLKSRCVFPPGGFQFVQPQTGWEAPAGVSFDAVVQALIAHRKANPALAKQHGWATDYASVANEVDAYNDARCRAHGWMEYVTGDPAPFIPAASRSQPPGFASAAGAVKRVGAGVKTLLDWLGSGGRPVEREQAESRASICETCPQNGTGDWTRFFTAPASEAIRRQLEIKGAMKLRTSKDHALGVCAGCLCPLKLKVWCPLPHILRSTDPSVLSKLDSRCWILRESGDGRPSS